MAIKVVAKFTFEDRAILVDTINQLRNVQLRINQFCPAYDAIDILAHNLEIKLSRMDCEVFVGKG